MGNTCPLIPAPNLYAPLHVFNLLLLLDPESGRIIDANNAAANFYGWTIDELREMRLQDITNSSADVLRSDGGVLEV